MELNLKTFIAVNADGQEVWRTRCFTKEQAVRKWNHTAPNHSFLAKIKEVK